MKSLNKLSPLYRLQTSSSSLMTLMQDLDKTAPPGKKYWVYTGPENATATAYCFFRPAPSIIFKSPTLHSASLLATRHPGCTPRSKNWLLIDYVIVSEGDRRDVRVTKTVYGAKYWTDHRLILSKLSIRVQPKTR